MAPQDNHGRFIWHELMTGDPAAAERFYRDVVGWSTQPSATGMPDYTIWTANDVPIGGMMKLTPDAVAMGAPPILDRVRRGGRHRRDDRPREEARRPQCLLARTPPKGRSLC